MQLADAHTLFEDSPCPELGELLSYKQGKIQIKEAHRIESHMVNCPLCSEAVEFIDANNKITAEEIGHSISRNGMPTSSKTDIPEWANRRNLMVGGLVFVATITSLLLLMNSGGPKEAEPAAFNGNNDAVQGADPTPKDWQEYRAIDTLGMSNYLIAPGEEISEIKKDEANLTIAPGVVDSDLLKPLDSTEEEGIVSPQIGIPQTEDKKQEPAKINVPFKVRIFNRENMDKRDRKGKRDEADTTGGKAYSKLFDQEDDFNPEGVATYPGGDEQLIKELTDKIVITRADDSQAMPGSATSGSATSGSAIVSFVVSAKGNITEIAVMKGLDRETDEIILKALHAMPEWNAGAKKGKEGKVKYTLMITLVD